MILEVLESFEFLSCEPNDSRFDSFEVPVVVRLVLVEFAGTCVSFAPKDDSLEFVL